ncbi:MAG: penicillin acylase family protein [Planctomycetota bacterium]|nr:penicillin acylase family protein [Planctomycetota bacterium]
MRASVGFAGLVSLLAGAAVALPGCVFGPPASNSIDAGSRQAAFPTNGLPLRAPATLRWTPERIPLIQAESDHDVALVMGMVHAHLRLAQMEFLRRLSQARLSEMAGPFTTDIDHTLRALNLGKAAPEIEKSLPESTRAYIERYVEGINTYRTLSPARSADVAWFGVREEPWTVRDVITIGRLASADVNWLFLFGSLRLRNDPAFANLWPRLRDDNLAGIPSFGPGSWGEAPAEPLKLIGNVSKSGSNCVVVGGSRTRSGSSLLAADPHVGLTLPNLWNIVAYSTPEKRVVGFTIAGLPAVLVGRNETISWGGTNMIGLNSSLYDATSLETQFTTREVTIANRFWPSSTREVVESPVGPVLSMTPLLEEYALPPTALKWRGHQPSDEVSAFLSVSRARTWDEFRASFEPYAVSGQNFLYADKSGNIGQLLAMEFDPAAGRTAMVLVGDPGNPEHTWGNPIKSTELPAAYNPSAGFLVSCNNTPVRTDPPVSLFTNADDRASRLAELIAAEDRFDVDAAKRLQQDVYARSAHRAAGILASRVRRALENSSDARGVGSANDATTSALVREIANWNGHYAAASRGAAAYETLLFHVASRGYAEIYSPEAVSTLLGSNSLHRFVAQDLEAGKLDGVLVAAAKAASVRWGEGRTWGDMHKINLSHVIGNVPVLGSGFQFGRVPASGSSVTINKSAHNVTDQEHNSTFGANARFVTDLASLDENYFCLLGGQDGWLGSKNFLDQSELWFKGEYVRVPLSDAGIARTFSEVMSLKP